MNKKILIIACLIMMTMVFTGCDLLEKNKDKKTVTEKSNNAVEEENLVDENESSSEIINDDVVRSNENDDDKEDALEEEEAYADEEDLTLFIEDGLVAYYPFNEDIEDYSGKKRDATNHNAYFVEGKYGEALRFNGKNSYVHALVNINPTSVPQMTMTAWVKETNGADIMQVISSDNAGYDRAMGADIRGAGEGWACFAGDGKVLGFHPLKTFQWTFIATVYNQNAETVKLFVDGSVYEKDAKTSKGNDFITIGARESAGRESEFFNGIIDEVKIYDYALSDKELNSLYKTGITKPKADK